MAKFIWAVIFGLLPFSLSLAQKYDYHWTFGDSAGIDFSDPEKPQSFKTYCMTHGSDDNQSCISTSSGKLLAYWAFDTIDLSKNFQTSCLRDIDNRIIVRNTLVYNLYSNGSLFVPHPEDSTRYYFFYISPYKPDQKTSCGKVGCTIFYSLFQITPDEKIQVLQHNQVLSQGEFSDKLAVIRHANGRDWWLLAHESTSNRFIRFIITPKGITNPAYQSIGRGPTSFELKKEFYYWGGEMVFSSQGSWLGISAGELDLLELYRFDRCTGLLSGLIVLGPNQKIQPDASTLDYYGICFSPDESKLYVTMGNYSAHPKVYRNLLQYDLNQKLPDLKKPMLMHQGGMDTSRVSMMEPAPNGKIYITQNKFNFLSVINQPNLKHPSCDFMYKGFHLKNGRCSSGLPSFPVFRVPTLPIPTGRIEVTLPDCPEEARVIGKQDYKFYVWDDGSNEDLRYIDYKPGISKYIRWAYDLEDTLCAVRCDTFYVTFRPAYLRISTSQSRQICQDDSLRIGDNQQCDSCYYRWLPRIGLKNANAKQTIAKPSQTTTYVRSTYIPNGCVVGTDTVFIRVIEKHVPPCTSVSRPEISDRLFNLYPNPAQETVTIQYPIQDHYHLTLLDITGRKLLSFSFNPSGEHTLDVSTLPKGIYILRFNEIDSEKLLIAR